MSEQRDELKAEMIAIHQANLNRLRAQISFRPFFWLGASVNQWIIR